MSLPETITWADNLRRAIGNIFLHILLPLQDYKINYECLFSKIDTCKITSDNDVLPTDSNRIATINETSNENRTNSWFNLMKDFINKVSFNYKEKEQFINSFSQVQNQIANVFHGALSLIKARSYVAQLMICSIIISHFIYRDVLYMMRYFKKDPSVSSQAGKSFRGSEDDDWIALHKSARRM